MASRSSLKKPGGTSSRSERDSKTVADGEDDEAVLTTRAAGDGDGTADGQILGLGNPFLSHVNAKVGLERVVVRVAQLDPDAVERGD